jgi:hypothetical protein
MDAPYSDIGYGKPTYQDFMDDLSKPDLGRSPSAIAAAESWSNPGTRVPNIKRKTAKSVAQAEIVAPVKLTGKKRGAPKGNGSTKRSSKMQKLAREISHPGLVDMALGESGTNPLAPIEDFGLDKGFVFRGLPQGKKGGRKSKKRKSRRRKTRKHKKKHRKRKRKTKHKTKHKKHKRRRKTKRR